MPRSLIPVITPHGSLRLDQADDDFVPESGLADRLEKSFERGSAHGLLHLGTSEAGSVLPASLAWWRDFGMRFIADLCALGDAKGPAGRTELAAPTSSELAALIDDAPPMRGGEYLRPEALVRTGLTPHNLPADCSNDRADECSTWTNSSKAAISIAK